MEHESSKRKCFKQSGCAEVLIQKINSIYDEMRQMHAKDILLKEKNLSEAQLEFFYLSSPSQIEKKIKSKDLEKFKPIKNSKIFYDTNNFKIVKKKLSNLINIYEKKIKKK